MVEIIKPADWNCPKPRKQYREVQPEYKKAICHHWITSIDIKEDYPSDQRARNIVNFHMAPKPKGRGWGWDAYDYMVGADGKVYEVHGCKTESFAEGPRPKRKQSDRFWKGGQPWWPEVYGDLKAFNSWNWRHFSILWMIGGKFKPSDNMIQSVIELEKHIIDQFPYIKYVVPHSGLQIKACTGPNVIALINAGRLGPTPVLPHADWPWQAQVVKPTKASDYQNAVKEGITDGSNPEKLGTREDMAVMAYRALRKARE